MSIVYTVHPSHLFMFPTPPVSIVLCSRFVLGRAMSSILFLITRRSYMFALYHPSNMANVTSPRIVFPAALSPVSGCGPNLRGTELESWSCRMFVIDVVHIQCYKLFKGMECAVLSMVMCTRSFLIRAGHSPDFGLPSIAILPLIITNGEVVCITMTYMFLSRSRPMIDLSH